MTLPVLLVPGLNCTAEAFARQIPIAWSFGPVTVADHRRGESIGAIANAILADAPPRFALLGFSMGGYIAFEILRQARERVARVAFLSTSARLDSPEQRENRLRQIAITEAGKFESIPPTSFENAVHPDNRSDEALRAIHRRMALANGPEVFVRQQRAILARQDSRADLAGIDMPAWVIVGEADRVTGVDAAREIAAGISGAHFVEVAGAGHFAPVEQPEGVNRAVAEWLST
jgi:Predicted hydrolases or acyltransferases (alpha/beta hydrolase superfamily)